MSEYKTIVRAIFKNGNRVIVPGTFASKEEADEAAGAALLAFQMVAGEAWFLVEGLSEKAWFNNGALGAFTVAVYEVKAK